MSDSQTTADLLRENQELRTELDAYKKHANAMETARLVSDSELCQLRSELASVTAENERLSDCINTSENITERINLVGDIKRLEAECANLERRRQYETDLVCAAIMESNARGVAFGSAELCARVDEVRALRARVAELESQIAGIRGYSAMPPSSTQEAMQAEIDIQRGRVLRLHANIEEYEQRNAELVAALREACVTCREHAAESATPKSDPNSSEIRTSAAPDVSALLAATPPVTDEMRDRLAKTARAEPIRAAIDAARKQGGEP